jgi:hypothetical protein
MDTADVERLRAWSQRVSKVLPEFEQFVFSWIGRKGYEKRLRRSLRSYREQLEELEGGGFEQVEDRILGQLAMGWVFSEPQMARAVYKALRASAGLSEDAWTFLRTAVDEPWFFTAFELITREGGDLMRFVDYDDGNHYIVQSPGLRDLFERDKTVGYGLLFYNGECFQTYGPIYYLAWADQKDMQWYARQVDEALFEREGLMEVMSADPLPWITLFSQAENPRIAHRGQVVELCQSEAAGAEFSTDALPEEAEAEWQGKVCRVRLDPDDPFYGPQLLWEGKRKRLILRAFTIDGYLRGREALRQMAELPEVPQYHCSGSMYFSAYKVLGPDEFARFDRQFSGEEGGQTADEAGGGDLGQLERAMSLLSEAHNAGEAADLERIAKESGLSSEDVKELEKQLKGMIDRNSPG